MKDFNYRLGKRVAELRKQAGLSQLELAERSDLDLSTVSLLERGQRSPRVETLYRVTQVLNITLVEFFNFDVRKKINLSERELVRLFNKKQLTNQKLVINLLKALQ